MSKATVFTIAEKSKQSKCLLTEWVKKLHIHTTRYLMQQKEWTIGCIQQLELNLRDILLNKLSQTQRITICMTSFMPKSRSSRTGTSLVVQWLRIHTSTAGEKKEAEPKIVSLRMVVTLWCWGWRKTFWDARSTLYLALGGAIMNMWKKVRVSFAQSDSLQPRGL